MIGGLSVGEPLSPVLKHWQRLVAVRQDIMSTMFDLDGALQSGQWGLVGFACRGLVNLSITAAALERGAIAVEFPRREREWRLSVETVAKVDPRLADHAFQLYLAPVGEGAEARAHCRRVLQFVGMCTGSGDSPSIASSLASWAGSANEFAIACRALGIPTADDWYLANKNSENWYEDVLRHLEEFDERT